MKAMMTDVQCHTFALHLILVEQPANFASPVYKRARAVFYNFDLTQFPKYGFVMLSAQLSFGGKERLLTMKTYEEWCAEDSAFSPTPYEWQIIAKYSSMTFDKETLTRGECNQLHNIIDQYDANPTHVFINESDFHKQESEIGLILSRLEKEI